MIHTNLKRLKEYKKLNHNLDIAIDWLDKQKDLASLPTGRIEISNNNDVYAMNIVTESFDSTNRIYEIHKHYADVHIIIEDEMFYFNEREAMGDRIGEYDAENDYELFNFVSEDNLIKPKIGDCLVFLPNEAHAPKCGTKIQKLKKLIIKVKW